MFIKFRLTTSLVGCDNIVVCKVPDNADLDYLAELGNELARDNAESYGVLDDVSDDEDESDYFDYSYEFLKGMTEEDIVDEYGHIDDLT